MKPTQKYMQLMPPLPGLCAVCASDHGPEQAHNLMSLYYQIAFHVEHRRWPTWLDAMAHCTEETRAEWVRALLAHGIALSPSYGCEEA